MAPDCMTYGPAHVPSALENKECLFTIGLEDKMQDEFEPHIETCTAGGTYSYRLNDWCRSIKTAKSDPLPTKFGSVLQQFTNYVHI